MSKAKNIILWVVAFVLMGAIAVFQRMTGPTYPVGGDINIAGTELNYSFPRSHGGEGPAEIKIEAPDGITGKIKYRRFKSHDEWTNEDLKRVEEKDDDGNNVSYLTAELPHLQEAGKYMYEVYLSKGNEEKMIPAEPVVLRFKGHVPEYFLIPHIIIMFSAMWFSMRTGFESIFKGNNIMMYSILTAILLFVGGIIMGPVIQKYAFGAYWTGWPFGHDLTDNKTLAAFIMWIIAAWRAVKNKGARGWALAAAIVTLAVYLIPHSVLGSEIDYTQLPK